MNCNMLVDKTAEAKKILRSGISSTSVHARSELATAAWYLINQTTYTPKQVESRLRSASADYFYGMSDSFIHSCLQDIITSVKKDSKDDTRYDGSITIYKSELERIGRLGHDDTERLAFIFLCLAKMTPYCQVYECNSAIYRLAWRYRYDANSKTVVEKLEKRRVGGQEPSRRVHTLCADGIVHYATRISSKYKRGKNMPSAASVFSVPILCNTGDIAFIIDHPDEDSLVLYYDRYKGYGGIITCERCGKPTLKTGRRQKYCGSCSHYLDHHSEKRGSCVLPA